MRQLDRKWILSERGAKIGGARISGESVVEKLCRDTTNEGRQRQWEDQHLLEKRCTGESGRPDLRRASKPIIGTGIQENYHRRGGKWTNNSVLDHGRINVSLQTTMKKAWGNKKRLKRNTGGSRGCAKESVSQSKA